MKRIYEAAAYGKGPIQDCFWAKSVPAPQYPALSSDLDCDVAIIGAGFTGLSAAYELAKQGVRVCVLEAQHPLFWRHRSKWGLLLPWRSQSKRCTDRQVGWKSRPA